MSEHLTTPQRETYPLISSNDKLVMVMRDHIIQAARPVIYVKGLTNATIRVDSGRNIDDRTGVRVYDYTAGATDTITLTVDGAATVLTEGTQFDAVTSNEITAENIRDAINTASIGLTAVAEGADVLVVPDFGIETVTVATSDANAWSVAGLTIFGALQTVVAGEVLAVELPVSTFDPLNKVNYLNVLSGKVSADLRSPVEVRTYFQMPGSAYGQASLNPTTGQPGGWPSAPNPPTP